MFHSSLQDSTNLSKRRRSVLEGIRGERLWSTHVVTCSFGGSWVLFAQVAYHYGEPVDPTEYQNEFIGQVIGIY